MCVLLTMTVVNKKVSDGRNKRDHLSHYNDVFKYYVEIMLVTNRWVDQFGVVEDKTILTKSIQDRVVDIKTDTDHTSISTVVERIQDLPALP